MGTVVNLQTPTKSFGDGYESLVVREYYTSTDGGVTLDVTGYTPANIRTGHVIIRKTAAESDGTYIYKPMPVNAGSVNGVATTDTLVGGSGYTAGSVLLQGGSGSGATATITVTTGEVTAVTITNAGNGYKVGDVLSISGGTGGTVTVATLSNAGASYAALPSGYEYYGHAVQSVSKDKPFVGVTYQAKINPLIGKQAAAQAAGIYDLTSILTALKAALTHVIYKGDKE